MCCRNNSVEDILRQVQSIRAVYAKNPVNHHIPNTVYPHAKPYVQQKMEMAPNGKYVKFVRVEKVIN